MDRLREYKTFVIKITSFEGIKSSKSKLPFFKARYYAVVSKCVPRILISRLKTPLGQPPGENHTWDFPMRFVAERSTFAYPSAKLVIQLRRRRPFCIDKDVGQKYVVSVKSLFENSKNDNRSAGSTKSDVRVVVKEASGEPIGRLNFSFKFCKREDRDKLLGIYGYDYLGTCSFDY